MSRWSDESTADFVTAVQNWWQESRSESREWRLEAREAFRMRAGDWENGQWEDEALAQMSEEQPIVSFNKIDVFCSAVTGLENLNRSQVNFIPRRPGPVQGGVTDILNGAARYVEEDGDVEFQQSHAFSDMVTSGMGWTETFIQWDTNPDGDLRTEQRDPLRCYWDTEATHRNLRDAKRRAHVKPMSVEEIQDQWPDVAEEDIAASLFFQDDLDEDEKPHITRIAPLQYKDNQGVSTTNVRDKGYVLHVQWYEMTAMARAVIQDPMTGQSQTQIMSKADFRAVEEALAMQGLPPPVQQPIKQRVYWRAFVCGDKLTERARMQTEDFTLQCMTGRYDRNQRMWYGLVRSLRDPQDWTNKLISKILWIMQYNSQGGGYFAEEDAVPDVRKFENSLASPDEISWVNPGALAAGKLQRKDPMPYPQGLDRLMTVAMSAFPEVTGISLELLGLADKVQPGVLEASRKQAGMTMLAWAFDSMKAYRKNYGRVLMDHIQAYLSDGRLIRISGEQGEQFVPLMREEMAEEYDILVSESPKSTNERDRVLAIMVQMMPMLRDSGVGFPMQLLDYLPLPTEMTEAWKQQAQGDPEQEQKEQQLMDMAAKLDLAKTKAEGDQKSADATLKQVQAAMEQYKLMTGDTS